MRVIVLGAPGTPPSDGEIERAWQLVQAMGQQEATKLILSGMDDAPPERDDVLDGWVALLQGVTALAQATRH
jgi:hypothetical protein